MKKYIIIFALMVFGWPLLPAFKHSGVVLIIGLLSVLVGLLMYRGDELKEAFQDDIDEDEAFKQRVLDKIEKSKKLHEICNCEEIKMPEMRNNAENQLTDDQQALLKMLQDNPHFKNASKDAYSKLKNTGVIGPYNKIDTKV